MGCVFGLTALMPPRGFLFPLSVSPLRLPLAIMSPATVLRNCVRETRHGLRQSTRANVDTISSRHVKDKIRHVKDKIRLVADKTRQNKTRQDKHTQKRRQVREDEGRKEEERLEQKTRQEKTTHTTTHDNTRQDKTRQDKTRHHQHNASGEVYMSY
jgi:hypothetical protein